MPLNISRRFPQSLPIQDKPLAVTTGNEVMAMGGAAAGVKFYCAYPMRPFDRCAALDG